MNSVFRFLASFPGRITRIILGILIAFGGIFTGNIILLIVGIVPLAAGVFDKCVFGPPFKLPFDGPALRKALEEGNTKNAPNQAMKEPKEDKPDFNSEKRQES